MQEKSCTRPLPCSISQRRIRPRMPVSFHLFLPLFVFTAGTLLSFFWMVVILGHRRQRTFERVLFFLCLSLFLFSSGSLLFLNGQIHYGESPQILQRFSWAMICAGLLFVPSLLIHLHLEYARIRGILRDQKAEKLWLAVSYLPLAY